MWTQLTHLKWRSHMITMHKKIHLRISLFIPHAMHTYSALCICKQDLFPMLYFLLFPWSTPYETEFSICKQENERAHQLTWSSFRLPSFACFPAINSWASFAVSLFYGAEWTVGHCEPVKPTVLQTRSSPWETPAVNHGLYVSGHVDVQPNLPGLETFAPGNCRVGVPAQE